MEGDFRKEIEARTPLGRIGKVDDIAPAAFLASPSPGSAAKPWSSPAV